MLELRLISLKDWPQRQGKALHASSVLRKRGEIRGQFSGAQATNDAEKKAFSSHRPRVVCLCVHRVHAQGTCVGWVAWHGMAWKRKLRQRWRSSWELHRFGYQHLSRCWGPFEPVEALPGRRKEMILQRQRRGQCCFHFQWLLSWIHLVNIPSAAHLQPHHSCLGSVCITKDQVGCTGLISKTRKLASLYRWQLVCLPFFYLCLRPLFCP